MKEYLQLHADVLVMWWVISIICSALAGYVLGLTTTPEPTTKKRKRPSSREKHERLLHEAVASEDYERAARLRDIIKQYN